MKIDRQSNYSIYKNILLAFLLTFSTLTFAQDDEWAAGLRLGDPTGLTLKKYDGDHAWQLNIGRSKWFYGDGWYNNRFNDWYGDGKYNYADYQYIGFKRSLPLAIQLHYLINNEITEWDLDGEGRLFWYYGFGIQFNYLSYVYDYRYKNPGDPAWYYADSERVYDIDFGADVVIGSEFIFSEIPLSVFLELNLFMEAFDDPFWIRGQGGVGARYHF
ncbi:MAG: hypothetical protein CMP59_07670 [Flavobacteriales bacterium]|nr:hypothetical protein [Flavobacteriales bacterium]|tara:strand:- start:514 stop:1161 length:648 start_codon:yes stop_codon:yes gene_type:complete